MFPLSFGPLTSYDQAFSYLSFNVSHCSRLAGLPVAARKGSLKIMNCLFGWLCFHFTRTVLGWVYYRLSWLAVVRGIMWVSAWHVTVLFLSNKSTSDFGAPEYNVAGMHVEKSDFSSRNSKVYRESCRYSEGDIKWPLPPIWSGSDIAVFVHQALFQFRRFCL